MKRILLDENIPIKLLDLAPSSCEVQHVLGLGWAHMPDDALLDHAEAAEFDIVLTADQSLAYQQNWEVRRISLLALTTNNWPVIREHAPVIFGAAIAAGVAVVEIVKLPHPVRPRRG